MGISSSRNDEDDMEKLAAFKSILDMDDDVVVAAKLSQKKYQHMLLGRVGLHAICQAASRGSLRNVALLVEAGLKVNPNRMIPASALVSALRNDCELCVTYLVSHNCDIDGVVDSNLGSPLMVAARNCRTGKCLDMLVRVGADVNRQDRRGFTALYHCIQSAYPEKIKILIKAGADITINSRDHKLSSLSLTIREKMFNVFLTLVAEQNIGHDTSESEPNTRHLTTDSGITADVIDEVYEFEDEIKMADLTNLTSQVTWLQYCLYAFQFKSWKIFYYIFCKLFINGTTVLEIPRKSDKFSEIIFQRISNIAELLIERNKNRIALLTLFKLCLESASTRYHMTSRNGIEYLLR